MSDNVVALPGVTDRAQPDALVVDLLERLLDEAKAGRIRAIAAALVYDAEVRAVFQVPKGKQAETAGAIGALQYDYHADWNRKE